MLGATDPRRIGLDEHPHRSGVQRPPATPSLAAVIACAAAPAHPTPTPGPACRPHPRNQQLVDRTELDTLMTVFSTPNRARNTPALRTPFSAHRFLTFDKPET